MSLKDLLRAAAVMPFAAPCFAADDAFHSITKEDLARHIEVLSSDSFEGRAPATAGEEKTVAYLTDHFRKAGAAPGLRRSFEQRIPLVEVRREDNSEFLIRNSAGRAAFDIFDEYVPFAGDASGAADIASAPLVFAGYGIDAPEFG
ncbi:MAG: peptidase M28, partial [Hyphococcus sp.]